MNRSLKAALFVCALAGGGFLIHTAWGGKSVNVPTMVDLPDGTRTLELPEDLQTYLLAKYPGFRIPKDTEYNAEMIQYFYSRLIGTHPCVAYGDFNGDQKRDYAMLIVTQETKWGPLVELVILNGRKKNGGDFDVFRIGEVYNFKDDYMSFQGNRLIKGKYKKSAWYINWDKKKNQYVNLKS